MGVSPNDTVPGTFSPLSKETKLKIWPVIVYHVDNHLLTWGPELELSRRQAETCCACSREVIGNGGAGRAEACVCVLAIQ